VAPRGQESLLYRVLRQLVVAEDAASQSVGDAAETVVQLAECRVVGARDERDERLVGQVRKGSRHRRRSVAHPAHIRPGQPFGSMMSRCPSGARLPAPTVSAWDASTCLADGDAVEIITRG